MYDCINSVQLSNQTQGNQTWIVKCFGGFEVF